MIANQTISQRMSWQKASELQAAQKARLEERERRQAVRRAAEDELARFNIALNNGKIAIIQTAFGEYEVDSVDNDWWYHTHPKGQSKGWSNLRSFAGCNDGTWAALMNQIGEPRNELFA